MLKRGFHGVLVTTGMTAQLSGISYPQTVLLEVTDHDPAVDQTEIGPFFVHYGRSGHCPGGLWFLIEDHMGKCLFTGDYQENTLAYACDPIKNAPLILQWLIVPTGIPWKPQMVLESR